MALVDRLLLQLGRFYNPYVNAPIVDLETRKRIVAMLELGDEEGARRLLDERLALYARMDDAGGKLTGPDFRSRTGPRAPERIEHWPSAYC